MSDEQQPTPENREWIAVPPPNPYTAAGSAAGSAPGGRGLAISAMALGLVAILTAVVAALYFSWFALLAAVLGVAAAGLGIAALVRRQTPRPASITGVITGALAVVVSVSAGALMLGAFLGAGIGSESDAAATGSEANGWTPGSEAESLIDWPANMATGGVLFTAGTAGPEPVRSAPITAGTAPGSAAIDRENGPADILLHVDYRCPHCVEFETANAQLLEELVQSGAATLEIRPLAFVSPFSVQLSGAMACLVDAQPESAWAAHRALLSPETQGIADAAELADALDAATGGLAAEARDCIESGRFVSFAEELSAWVTRNPVPNAVDPQLRVQGTPLAVVNGVAYTGHPDDGAAFAAFLAELGL